LAPLQILDYPNAELVFGLVAPVGTNLSSVEEDLTVRAEGYG
jgi:hypothetical protein